MTREEDAGGKDRDTGVHPAVAEPTSRVQHRPRIGLVVNPVAGIGGPAALRGSDGEDIQARARAVGVTAQAGRRVHEALLAMGDVRAAAWFTWDGPMGADVLTALDVPCAVLGAPAPPSPANAMSNPSADDSERPSTPALHTTPADTRQAVRTLRAHGVDLLLFAGGDGTARDVLVALAENDGSSQLCLGIPAGVKMHSSVFALTPHAAGMVLQRFVAGAMLEVREGEVRDIDEAALRAGRIDNRWFGNLRVPALAGFMQNLKQGGRESEPLAQEEAAAGVVAMLQDGVRYVLGAGSTLLAVKRQLGFDGTLLGVDVWQDGQVLARDVDEPHLRALVSEGVPMVVVLSPTGHQGMLLGRGNQQVSARFLRESNAALCVVATRGKLAALDGRPLWVDTGDALLDAQLCGFTDVVCGYETRLLYRIATA